MAFIPDNAMDLRRTDKLTPAAWVVYETLCRYRTQGTVKSYASRQTLAEKSGLSVGTINNALSELGRKKWVDITRQCVILAVGDFSPVLKSAKTAAESSLNSETSSLNDEDWDSQPSLNDEKPSLNDETSSLNREDCLLETSPNNEESSLNDEISLNGEGLPDAETSRFDDETSPNSEETYIGVNSQQKQQEENQVSLRECGSVAPAPAREDSPPVYSEAVNIYYLAFAAHLPRGVKKHAARQIDNRNLTDMRAWQKVCGDWFTNDWNHTNLTGMFDRYEREVEQGQTNGATHGNTKLTASDQRRPEPGPSRLNFVTGSTLGTM